MGGELTEDDVRRIVRDEYARIESAKFAANCEGLRHEARALYERTGRRMFGKLYEDIYEEASDGR